MKATFKTVAMATMLLAGSPALAACLQQEAENNNTEISAMKQADRTARPLAVGWIT